MTEPYWGGYTAGGQMLHLAARSAGTFAVSACGRLLTGGAGDVPEEHRGMQCRMCLTSESARAEVACERLPLTSAQVRTLLALVHVHGRDGRATIRAVAETEGASPMTTHARLARLRAAGLVEMSPAPRVLRPLVRPVQAG